LRLGIRKRSVIEHGGRCLHLTHDGVHRSGSEHCHRSDHEEGSVSRRPLAPGVVVDNQWRWKSVRPTPSKVPSIDDHQFQLGFDTSNWRGICRATRRFVSLGRLPRPFAGRVKARRHAATTRRCIREVKSCEGHRGRGLHLDHCEGRKETQAKRFRLQLRTASSFSRELLSCQDTR